MSTPDQQGNQPLTRKQLREIRLTGATPVISEEQAAAAAAAEAPESSTENPVESVVVEPVVDKSAADESASADSAPTPDSDASLDGSRLTRRQAREHERIRTASLPVIVPEESRDEHESGDTVHESDSEQQQDHAQKPDDGMVSGLPTFGAGSAQSSGAGTDLDADLDDDTDDEVVIDVAPVSAVTAADSTGEAAVIEDAEDADDAEDSDADISELGIVADDDDEDDAEDGNTDLPVADPIDTGERPVVNPTFGRGLLSDQAAAPAFTPSFDELITSDSGGSQHLAPNTLIFNPSPNGGSLSGPVASTGEVLITGSYDLPRGIGSQGHAHGTTDGKEADAVLIDGELALSSSPTPIAASSAVSTIKPAGEVIRPPAPEKGNKLMLTLAITAGGLALALAVALIVAFTTNVF
ncbi:hypothetical protein DC31_10345 [Microbacterium sp. CH12i]|uniref:hypothetical protein n=1 Tax=Microbacterium sp. CH12i TaxID=1479651 RepID=UPI000461B73C|nr:hypothetical protein [Microbacterium sp. CH12i]KDA06254.1 hypothetical protein DC31_10345 [Microbacterium sp. CH12i]